DGIRDFHVTGVQTCALPISDLQRGIEAAVAPPGRLEPVTGPGDPFAVLVDYAHTDDALRKVLAAVRPLVPAGGRLVVVFGCGGGDREGGGEGSGVERGGGGW